MDQLEIFRQLWHQKGELMTGRLANPNPKSYNVPIHRLPDLVIILSDISGNSSATTNLLQTMSYTLYLVILH